MSLIRGETKIDNLYIGLGTKTFLQGQNVVERPAYTVSKDNVTIFTTPFITLDVGTTYNFHIDTPGHPFYITTDRHGAGVVRTPVQSLAGSIEIVPESTGTLGNVGIEKGILSWTPESVHTQMKLFYQCNYHPDMGNSITVV